MTGVTDDPLDPALTRGIDTEPRPQADKYLVLSESERAKGFVRPVRRSYLHVGRPGPTHPLVDLTAEQAERYADFGYVKYEPYDENEGLGRYWTQERLDAVGKGCGAVTYMGDALAETYARDPGFYGATYCAHCKMHRPVGKDGEFIWDDESGQRVGT